MTRRQGHLIDFRDIPGADEVTARIRIVLETVDEVRNLVDVSAIGSRPAAPLMAIDRAQVAVFVGPFVPNRDLVVVQILDIRIAFQEPQQLMNNAAQVEFLCRKAREAFGKVGVRFQF